MLYGTFYEVEGELAREFRFLAKAVCLEEFRAMMMHVEVEEVEPATEARPYPILRAIATDGRRMHIVEPLSPATGIYGMKPGHLHVVKVSGSKVQLAEKTDPSIQDFPNWRKVLPKGDAVSKSTFNGFTLKGSRLSTASGNISRLFRSFPKSTPINLQYLDDLGYGEEWEVEWRNERSAVTFRSGNRLAVIMPMMGDDE